MKRHPRVEAAALAGIAGRVLAAVDSAEAEEYAKGREIGYLDE